MHIEIIHAVCIYQQLRHNQMAEKSPSMKEVYYTLHVIVIYSAVGVRGRVHKFPA